MRRWGYRFWKSFLLCIFICKASLGYAQQKAQVDLCKDTPENIRCQESSESNIELNSSEETTPEQVSEIPEITSINLQEQFKDKTIGENREDIEILKKLIAKTPKNDPDYPLFLFRYAEELYIIATNYLKKARDVDDEVYQAKRSGNKSLVVTLQKEVRKNENKSKKTYEKSYKNYLEIATNYKGYKKRAEVLFYTGFVLKKIAEFDAIDIEKLIEEGNKTKADLVRKKIEKLHKEARAHYGELITQYATSKYVPDAFLEFAEFYFDDGDMKAALQAYQKVATYKKSRVYAYSIYKQAWCHLNLTQYQNALDTFVELVEYSRKEKALGSSDNSVLINEGLRGIVRTYAKFKSPDRAKSFLQKVAGPEHYIDMMATLGKFYFAQGDFLYAIDIYEQVIDIDPDANENYQYQYEICLIAQALATQNFKGAKARFIKEVKTLSIMYQRLVSRNVPASLQQDAKEKTSQILRNAAIDAHRVAEKTKTKKTYEQAKLFYQEFLKNFRTIDGLETIIWNYAELLYRLAEMGAEQNWEEAAMFYKKLVVLNPEGKYVDDAAFAAIISYQKALQVTPIRPENSTQIAPIPSRETRIIEDLRFLSSYVSRSIAKYCEYEIARIYYLYQHFDKAVPIFTDLVNNHSQYDFSAYASIFLLESLQQQKNEKKLGEYARKLKENPTFSNNEEIRDTLDVFYAEALGRECKNLEKETFWAKAGDCYASMFENLSKSSNEKAIIYNAAVTYEKANKTANAIFYRDLLAQSYPDTEEGQKSIFALGRLYGSIIFYEKAAAKYEEFANKFPKNSLALDALNNAAIYRQALNQFDTAIDNYKKYITLAKRQNLEYRDVFFQIANVFEKQKEFKKAFHTYKDYVKKYSKDDQVEYWLIAKTRIAAFLWNQSKSKNKQVVLDHCQQVLATIDSIDQSEQNLTTGLLSAAECAFYLAEQSYNTFQKFKIPSTEKQLKPWFEQSLTAMSKTKELYEKVKTYGSINWTLAAFARQGLVYHTFMKNLFQAPLPRYIKRLKGTAREDAEESYQQALDQYTEPLRQKALDSFNTCISHSTKNSWYNQWSALCEAFLHKMDPSTYPIADEWKAKPLFDSPIVIPASLIKKLK